MKPNDFPLITSDPDTLGGKPCVKGTRISIEMILEWLASGASQREILKNYPQLTEQGLQEAISYAARFLKNEVFIQIKE